MCFARATFAARAGWYRCPMKERSTVQGTVIRIDAGQTHVDTPEGVLRCVLRGRLTSDRPPAKSKGQRAAGTEAALAVGDHVLVLVTDAGQGAIEEVLPRRTKLSRR